MESDKIRERSGRNSTNINTASKSGMKWCESK